jgi:hypothetical protein
MIPNRRSAQQKVADFSDKIMLQKEACRNAFQIARPEEQFPRAFLTAPHTADDLSR